MTLPKKRRHTYNIQGQIENAPECGFKKVATAFGTCWESYTVFGNISIRRNKLGDSTLSFKGSKDTDALLGLLSTMFGKGTFDQIIEHKIPSLSQTCGAVFSVHMAVVSAAIGKWLYTSHGCLLETVVLDIFKCKGMKVLARSDEELNSIKLLIDDWEQVYDVMRSVDPDIQITALPPVSSTTITLTAKGAIQACFSWKKCINWTKGNETNTLAHCDLLIKLFRECC